MTAATIVAALDKARRTGTASWVACCPAHEDRNPSLAVRELDDGRVLLRCFSGCGAAEVLAAIGMSLADLYPPRASGPGSGCQRERRPMLPADVFELARRELGVITIVANDMVRQRAISEADFERLQLAQDKIERIAEAAYGR